MVDVHEYVLKSLLLHICIINKSQLAVSYDKLLMCVLMGRRKYSKKNRSILII